LAHFKQLVSMKREQDYLGVDPLVGKWKSPQGFSNPRHYKSAIYLMEHHNVIWRSYETKRDLMPFQDTCWYSGWIMADKDRMCRHLPKWVLRQYDYVHVILRPPTTIGDLEPAEVVMTFIEFDVHVLSQQERSDLVPQEN
jgi:hypothetical protein